jgi:hypothetical protein
MTKFLKTTIAALALAVPVAAFAETDTTTFERDGYTYVYTTKEKGGATILAGKRYPGAEVFRLVVENGRVRGISNGRPVSFRLSEVEPADARELASR